MKVVHEPLIISEHPCIFFLRLVHFFFQKDILCLYKMSLTISDNHMIVNCIECEHIALHLRGV